MRHLLVNVLKNETILVVASILALISCFIVPPDGEYAGYIHASTISQLICLMIVVCGFQRIGIPKGESRTVTFELGPEAFQVIGPDMQAAVEPGDFTLAVGASSQDIRLEGTLTL